jgi:serine/threonine protein kinase
VTAVGPPGFRVLPGSEQTTVTSRLCLVERGGQRFVCKRPTPRTLRDEWAREAFLAEGRVLETLGGDGAPGLVEAGEDGLGPYIVMEKVDVPPLAGRMGARDADFTAAASGAVLGTLARVHARDVLHSDLSPGNLLVGARVARLIDFGLARWSGAPRHSMGAFRGTLLYAAPELARGEPIDARADLFAAGASILHAHSGEAPRARPNDAAMLLSAGDEPIDAWATRASEGLPSAVRDALRACCAFDREARPISARELAACFAEPPAEL